MERFDDAPTFLTSLEEEHTEEQEKQPYIHTQSTHPQRSIVERISEVQPHLLACSQTSSQIIWDSASPEVSLLALIAPEAVEETPKRRVRPMMRWENLIESPQWHEAPTETYTPENMDEVPLPSKSPELPNMDTMDIIDTSIAQEEPPVSVQSIQTMTLEVQTAPPRKHAPTPLPAPSKPCLTSQPPPLDPFRAGSLPAASLCSPDAIQPVPRPNQPRTRYPTRRVEPEVEPVVEADERSVTPPREALDTPTSPASPEIIAITATAPYARRRPVPDYRELIVKWERSVHRSRVPVISRVRKSPAHSTVKQHPAEVPTVMASHASHARLPAAWGISGGTVLKQPASSYSSPDVQVIDKVVRPTTPDLGMTTPDVVHVVRGNDAEPAIARLPITEAPSPMREAPPQPASPLRTRSQLPPAQLPPAQVPPATLSQIHQLLESPSPSPPPLPTYVPRSKPRPKHKPVTEAPTPKRLPLQRRVSTRPHTARPHTARPRGPPAKTPAKRRPGRRRQPACPHPTPMPRHHSPSPAPTPPPQAPTQRPLDPVDVLSLNLVSSRPSQAIARHTAKPGGTASTASRVSPASSYPPELARLLHASESLLTQASSLCEAGAEGPSVQPQRSGRGPRTGKVRPRKRGRVPVPASRKGAPSAPAEQSTLFSASGVIQHLMSGTFLPSDEQEQEPHHISPPVSVRSPVPPVHTKSPGASPSVSDPLVPSCPSPLTSEEPGRPIQQPAQDLPKAEVLSRLVLARHQRTQRGGPS
eukprot:gnl/Dysnectes_brevis/8887_a16138_148.p1 GENE.gnl/Dysnectes_brevis/8887_a16138_148~~gnl/Dysnectes_brevis/8887_a16138_148.p1  ORF type:complete len:758 (+),score=181.21 gnl/Dysnectes_brevis/8887_a16138_148:3-2276(+)